MRTSLSIFLVAGTFFTVSCKPSEEDTAITASAPSSSQDATAKKSSLEIPDPGQSVIERISVGDDIATVEATIGAPEYTLDTADGAQARFYHFSEPPFTGREVITGVELGVRDGKIIVVNPIREKVTRIQPSHQ